MEQRFVVFFSEIQTGINLVPIYLNAFVLWTEDIPMTSAGSVNLILSSTFCGESSLHKYPGVQSFDVNISRQLKFFTLFHFNVPSNITG